MILACRYLNGTDNDKLYDAAQPMGSKASLDLGNAGVHEVEYYHLHKDNVDWVFVDHAVYHRKGKMRRGDAYLLDSGQSCGRDVRRGFP